MLAKVLADLVKIKRLKSPREHPSLLIIDAQDSKSQNLSKYPTTAALMREKKSKE
jgi:hypothetical protein